MLGAKGASVVVRTFKDLAAWQRAMDLVVAVYLATKDFPKEEVYGLTSQMRRAAVSVPSNIAEGQGRGIGNEFARHLRIAQGSLQELETQLMLAKRLGFLSTATLTPMIDLAAEVGRVVRGLHKSVANC